MILLLLYTYNKYYNIIGDEFLLNFGTKFQH